MQGKLGELAAAQQVYELGGFTIEAALAQAGQLAPIGITYTPGPIRGTATTPTALDPNSPYRMRAVSVGQEMTRSPDDSAFFTSPSHSAGTP